MSNIKDISGNRFGMLTVIKASDLRCSDGSVMWECICDCGNTKKANTSNLKFGNVKSCGCLVKHDLVNKIFDRLTVISDTKERLLSGGIIWLCKCKCGNETKVDTASLLKNHTRSCGCLATESRFSHNQTNTSEYRTWAAMKDRCLNSNSPNYINYGGRGISVCDRWLNSFESFYADLGPRPSDNHSIDRFPNNDGNYEPGNCRWATKSEQDNNRRTNVNIVYKNKQYTIAQIAREYNINDVLLYQRLSRGWSIDRAIETPVR